MALELIAALVAGFAVAGIAMLLRLFLKDRMPRWTIPAAAGLGMLAFTVWNEYDWFNRAEATLPPGVTIAWANAETAIWRPWTYVKPITTRFMAVDARDPRTHPAAPDQVLVRVVMMGRFAPGADIPVLFDCAQSRSVELTDERITFGEDGQVTDAAWRTLSDADPVLRTACDGG